MHPKDLQSSHSMQLLGSNSSFPPSDLVTLQRHRTLSPQRIQWLTGWSNMTWTVSMSTTKYAFTGFLYINSLFQGLQRHWCWRWQSRGINLPFLITPNINVYRRPGWFHSRSSFEPTSLKEATFWLTHVRILVLARLVKFWLLKSSRCSLVTNSFSISRILVLRKVFS